ncbi:hypothetical protein [uncultured Fusobacterium sp.]|uniref:hypothetical protein n=1 Tax=uncultured Fusobacterium sp. TaxID=159267 RepID=UPI0025F72FA5|nr:hypothetical protein [uncultured Fusobacterium sp.]
MKKYLFLGILTVLLIGCNNVSKKVELTPKEISQIGENSNQGAEILVRKAIIKEMSEYKYTPEEKKMLDEALENLEIEFFLNRVSVKRVNITDEQVLSIYEANKEQLKNIKPEIALPQIKEQLILQQANREKINYINSLVEKYQLNEKFKTYFPTQEVVEESNSVK